MNARKAKIEAAKKKAAAKNKTNTKTKLNRKHTVKHGDTLSAIAQKYGVTVQSIKTANKMKKSDIIKSGQVLVIPSK